MPRLIVKNFGCITDADLKLSHLTLIIGPQSSGKSLLSKLLYFCTAVQTDYVYEGGVSISGLRNEIEKEFIQWFPVSAWGTKRFSITYVANGLAFEFIRNKVGGDRVRLVMPTEFSDGVANFSNLMKSLDEGADEQQKVKPVVRFEEMRTLRDQEEKRLAALFKEDFADFQIFIPAGRSLFINLQLAFAATRESDSLDPLTARFGRFFNRIRTRSAKPSSVSADEGALQLPEQIQKLLGGQVERRKEALVLSADDGRLLPLNVLSSGQQELLPLLLMVSSWGMMSKSLLYIEEPEAHLFPSSQSMLAEYLISKLNADADLYGPAPCKLIMTTHSPYFLAKINNLLKAGQLGVKRSSALAGKVENIVAKSFWLTPDSTSAYAIEGGRLISIIDEDGLIDADFLDGVSREIVQQYSALVDLEFSE